MSALRPELRQLPNQLTAARLVLVPTLWTAALLGDGHAVGIGLALSFVLDWGDGFAARRLNLCSTVGSKFDSFVDALMTPSAIAWLLILQPAALFDHRGMTLAWFAVTYASLFLGIVKFRRIANLHLHSSRVACVAQYAFGVDALIAPPYNPAFFYAAATLGIISSLETLALQIARKQVHERLGSILIAPRQVITNVSNAGKEHS